MTISNTTLPLLSEYYRFALLLTGSTARAEAILLSTLASHPPHFRHDPARHAWFIQNLRKLAPSPPPSPPSTPPSTLPALPEILPNLPSLFHSLPEPGRSALALFYLHLFSNSEIAELLLLPLDSLPALIGSTRLQLASSLHP